jgi:TonB family protein
MSNSLLGQGAEEELTLQSTFASTPDPMPADSHASVNILTESLTRLELNSLEMKFYLDSIDQRIGRMEPRLENIPSLALLAAPPLSSQHVGSQVRDPNDAKFSAIVQTPTEHNDFHPIQDLDAATQPNEVENAAPSQRVNEFQEPEPTRNKPADEYRGALTQPWTRYRHLLSSEYTFSVLLLCTALLLAGMVYMRLGRDTTHANFAPASETLQPVPESLPPETQKPSATSTADTSNTTSSYVAKSGLSADPRSPIASRQANTRTSNSFDPSPGSAPAHSESSAEVASGTNSGTDAPSPEPAPRAATRWTPLALSNRRVNVSSGVMAANLLSAPKPNYPKIASLTHTQGNVVMQAIISKKGTVENLRVIKGHHLLRGAATSAVRTWRFRPYLVDGVPVEVATIVSVDFARH